MHHQHGTTRTLYDYRGELQWVNMLGWSDDELGKVPVHEQATAGEPYINLANFGGTGLGVTERGQGGTTSADARAIRNMFVFKSDTPSELYNRLEELARKGGPSAYQESGKFGEKGEAKDFPPRKSA